MSKILGVHSGGRIGEVMDHGSSTLPSYALACDGSAVSRVTYATLFLVIGTLFGVGDGSTTFNLPNGFALFKRGAGSQTVAGVSLAATHGVTQNDQMQGHQHALKQTAMPIDITHFSATAGNSPLVAGSGTRHAYANEFASGLSAQIDNPVSDGANGAPRTGTETRPANFAVTYGIIFK